MKRGGWLEISIEADGEMAEAVADLLSRYIPESVAIESTAVEQNPLGSAVPVGALRVRGYLALEPGWEEARRRIEEGLYYLGRIRPLAEPVFRIVEPQDWNQIWKAGYQPVTIGRRLVVLPPWLEAEEAGRLPVFIDPGMAFGTGTHPTTQLCLELLESLDESPALVIDVGCGSGVLAIAALKLGAGTALAVDVDPDAIQAARENAERNGVADRLDLAVGSLEALPEQASGGLAGGRLVFANILAPVIVKLLGEGLAELVGDQGRLILSGILAEQEMDVRAAMEARGLVVVDRRQREDWVALVGA